MLNLSGYSFEQLRQDGDLVLSRGRRQGESRSLLLLTARSEHPPPSINDQLRRIYSLRDELDCSWSACPLDLIDHLGASELVLHDPGGDFLDSIYREAAALRELLSLAISMTKALGFLHARGLVHRDIKPANFLVNTHSGKAWLTGFAISSRLPRERQPPSPPEVIAGTLAYMPPSRQDG